MGYYRFFKKIGKALRENGLNVTLNTDSIKIDFKNGRSATLNEEYLRNCHDMFNRGRAITDIVSKICDDLIDIYTKGKVI